MSFERARICDSLLMVFFVLALFQSSVLTWVGASTSSPVTVDHVGDPASDSFAPMATRLRISSSRFAETVSTDRGRVNIQPGNSTFSSKLAVRSANIKGRDRRASTHQRSPLGVRDWSGHGRSRIAEQDVHIFQTNTTGLGIQEVYCRVISECLKDVKNRGERGNPYQPQNYTRRKRREVDTVAIQ